MRKIPSKEEIEALYNSGESQRSIGEKFGYSQSEISKLMKEYGIKTRVTNFGKCNKKKSIIEPKNNNEVEKKLKKVVNNKMILPHIKVTEKTINIFNEELAEKYLLNNGDKKENENLVGYEVWKKTLEKEAEVYWADKEIHPERGLAYLLIPRYGKDVEEKLLSVRPYLRESKELKQLLMGDDDI